MKMRFKTEDGHRDVDIGSEVHPQKENQMRCPSCDSPTPRMRPSLRHEGEIKTCADPFHEAHPQKENAPVVEPWMKDAASEICEWAEDVEHYGGALTKQVVAEKISFYAPERARLQAQIEV